MVKGSDPIEDANMMNWYFEEIITKVFQKQSFSVVLGIWRDLVFLIMQFARRGLEVFVLLFDFQSFALFFTHYQLITL